MQSSYICAFLIREQQRYVNLSLLKCHYHLIQENTNPVLMYNEATHIYMYNYFLFSAFVKFCWILLASHVQIICCHQQFQCNLWRYLKLGYALAHPARHCVDIGNLILISVFEEA